MYIPSGLDRRKSCARYSGRMRVSVDTRTYIETNIYTYILQVHVCVCMYIYIYIHISIQIQIQIYTWRPWLKEGLRKMFKSKRITRNGSSALGFGAKVVVDSKFGSDAPVCATWLIHGWCDTHICVCDMTSSKFWDDDIFGPSFWADEMSYPLS